ncbi:Uu.00g065160.m01.CDS01 [Anthostomella pinea]|uniref:Uu.00g065160.m01.CDS01 n=1 Tax=Anthostomella pinea TaxID=933095 RepID=A0AAI8VTP6_9PEZI|nr:Uu.00g065160.m01.CDS01 [Anthostomella pinea]
MASSEKDDLEVGEKQSRTSSSPSVSNPIEEKETDVEAAKPPAAAADVDADADPNEVDWDGPDDPHNPKNWPVWRRGVIVGMAMFDRLLDISGGFRGRPGGASTPRGLGFEQRRGGDLMGTAVGPLLLAPLSELRGRRIVYNLANLGFSAFTIGCALSPTLGGLIALRFLQGCAASCSINNGGGTIADVVPTHRRGSVMSIFSMAFMFGPVIGPIIGSYLAAAAGWRWTGTLGVINAIFTRETYAPVILERKAKRLQKEIGNKALYAKGQRQLPFADLMRRNFSRPIRMLLFCPLITGLSLYIAFVYGVTYLLFSTFSFMFEGQYHYSRANLGLAYLGLAVGMFISLTIAGLVSDKTYVHLTQKHGEEKPTIPIGLFFYGWTAQYQVHSSVPIIATAFIGFGNMFTFHPTQTYMIDAYTKYASSAIAASSVLRSLAGALLPLAGLPLYDKLGLGWGNSLLGFLALAMGALPLLFNRYGEQLRKRYPLDLD